MSCESDVYALLMKRVMRLWTYSAALLFCLALVSGVPSGAALHADFGPSVTRFKVQGVAMEPTLHDGQYISIDPKEYVRHGPARRDLILFRAIPAGQPDHLFVKRVIALPGETVAIRNRKVYIDGQPLREPYVHHPADYTFPSSRVRAGTYFVLGDNRNNSDDSHLWKWLPRQDIVGKVRVKP